MVKPFLLTLDKNAKNLNTISKSLRDLASDSSHARLLSITMFSPKPRPPPAEGLWKAHAFSYANNDLHPDLSSDVYVKSTLSDGPSLTLFPSNILQLASLIIFYFSITHCRGS